MPYAVSERQCPPLFRGGRQRNADHLPARIRRRPHQLGTADALLLARAPLHRLFRARLYAVATCRRRADAYTYKHFYTDALAVLDHLKIPKAHFVGLSMGSYSSLQVGLNAPKRALSMTLAGVGSGSNLENLEAFREQCQANAEQYEQDRRRRGREGDARGAEPDSVPGEGPARHADFYDALARHDAQGLGQHHARFSGRPALDLHDDRCDPEGADADPDHLRRRGRQLHRAEPVPEEAPAGVGTGDVSEVRPRAQSRGAGAVQRNGRALYRAGRGRPLARARSAVADAADDVVIPDGLHEPAAEIPSPRSARPRMPE